LKEIKIAIPMTTRGTIVLLQLNANPWMIVVADPVVLAFARFSTDFPEV
jgi:hypothetical protein